MTKRRFSLTAGSFIALAPQFAQGQSNTTCLTTPSAVNSAKAQTHFDHLEATSPKDADTKAIFTIQGSEFHLSGSEISSRIHDAVKQAPQISDVQACANLAATVEALRLGGFQLTSRMYQSAQMSSNTMSPGERHDLFAERAADLKYYSFPIQVSRYQR